MHAHDDVAGLTTKQPFREGAENVVVPDSEANGFANPSLLQHVIVLANSPHLYSAVHDRTPQAQFHGCCISVRARSCILHTSDSLRSDPFHLVKSAHRQASKLGHMKGVGISAWETLSALHGPCDMQVYK